MASSIRIARVFGINIELHFSFILLILFLLPVLGWAGLFFFATVFTFVLLHELAHSLVAKAFGIPVDKIVLILFGGVANVEVPEKPKLELVMAAAGPAFNFMVAGVAGLMVFSSGLPYISYLDVVSPEKFTFTQPYILYTILYVNLLLGLFNVVPGFPMDGGRVLRSMLALKMDYLRATELSVSVGQRFIFPLLFVVGIFDGNVILALISVVLFVASGGELKMVKLKNALRGLTVADISVGKIPKVDGSMRTRDFVDSLEKEFETHYIVYGEGGRVQGVLNTTEIRSKDFDKQLSALATQDYEILDASRLASDSLKELLSNEFILVVSDKKVAGYVTPRNVSEAYKFHRLKKAIR
ncbi:MAG: site-2 protease family protein [Methanobacteriota archaeon]